MSKKVLVGLPGWLMCGLSVVLLRMGEYDLAIWSMLTAIYLRVIHLRLED